MNGLLATAIRRMQFTAKTRARTWRLVADLLEAGLQLSDALVTAAAVARDQGKGGVAALLEDIREGIPHAEFGYRASFYTPGSEALLFQMVSSGDAERIFRSAMRLAEQREKLTRAVLGAIAKPAIIFLLLGGVFYTLGSSLYPSLAEISPMSRWPSLAQWVGAFSIWFSANFAWVLLFCAGVFFGARVFLEQWTSAPREIFDRFLPFSLYKMQAGCGFIFTVSELGRVGVTLNSGLLHQMADQASSPYLRSRIRAIARELEVGSWADALKATGHDFPARDLNAVMGALNGQENWIRKFSDFLDRWLDDFDGMVQSRMALLNLALVALVAATLMGTLFSMLSIIQTLQ